MKVRNERLYACLLQLFKKVHVNRQGDVFKYKTNVENGRKSLERINGGEVYVMQCPLCKDTRFRLNVHHVFGMYVDGVLMNYQAHCWNCEGPVSKWLWEHYQMFEEHGPSLTTASVECHEGPLRLSDVAADSERDLVRLTGIKRLDQLPADSPALQYLLSRHYDPYMLASTYAVGYCDNSDYKAKLAHKRIIIPILFEGRYVGWQSRAIPCHTKLTIIEGKEHKAWPYQEPKYWTSTGTRKSYFLYNHDVARLYDTVVVVEGPTDAWRIGMCGVAILGRQISQYQATQLVENWGTGQIAMIGDPGFEQDWMSNKRKVEDLLGREVQLYVPDGKDPGDHTTEELWETLNARGIRTPTRV